MTKPTSLRDRISNKVSFRQQILLTFTVGMLSLAIAGSIVTAWVSSKRVEQLLISQGINVTNNLAEQSILALLYASGENARDAVLVTLSFPDVHRVSILDVHKQTILDEVWKADGHQNQEMDVTLLRTPATTSELIEEQNNAWFFSAPVYSGTEAAAQDFPLYATNSPDRELLGYVYVMMSKDSLHSMQYSIFSNNIIIAISLSLGLLIFLNLFLKRLSRPLHALSGIMIQAETGDTTVRAEISGPREFIRIATVFNKMMDTLEERNLRLQQANEILETEVGMRTQELVYARDVALDASQHKSEFLANVTHELRTPLQAIIGYTDVLIESLADEGLLEQSQDLERVMSNASHLLKLINDLLDLAKIEAGKFDLELVSISLKALLDEVEHTLQPLMRQNRNELQIHLQDAIGSVTIDRGRLLQILLNLGSNAGKFTQQGRIEIRVEHEPQWLYIEVEDNGIGMNEAQQAVIFDQFRQADGSVTRRFGGTGLGLSITHQLCQLMNGEIRVHSELGAGSRFSIQIPLPLQAKQITE